MGVGVCACVSLCTGHAACRISALRLGTKPRPQPWKSKTLITRPFTFTFHFHALEKEMATHSSVLAWRIPGTEEPGGLPSMGSHRVRHDWSDLAAAAAGHQGTPSIHILWSRTSICGHSWTPDSRIPSCQAKTCQCDDEQSSIHTLMSHRLRFTRGPHRWPKAFPWRVPIKEREREDSWSPSQELRVLFSHIPSKLCVKFLFVFLVIIKNKI